MKNHRQHFVEAQSLPTRPSLLSRMKNEEDDVSWKQFFDSYWRMIYGAARRAGLNDDEAQDVVQDTVLSVSRTIGEFRYDPKRGKFKGWLMRLTQWRIVDQMRRRPKYELGLFGSEQIETVGSECEFSEIWDREWNSSVIETALERVRTQVCPLHFQIYELTTFQDWGVGRAAKAFEMTSANIYLIRHRIGRIMKKEMRALETASDK